MRFAVLGLRFGVVGFCASVRITQVVCEVSFVAFGRSGQVSEARLESTFLADDAACLTLVGAVIQLRCLGFVSPGCGLLSCVVVWFFLNGIWVSAEFYSLSLIA